MAALRLSLLAVVLACASSRQAALHELVALKVEAAQLDASYAGAFLERVELELSKAATKEALQAAIRDLQIRRERVVALMKELNVVAHTAAIRILNEEAGDHVAPVRAIVCELRRVVRVVVPVMTPGPFARRCGS